MCVCAEQTAADLLCLSRWYCLTPAICCELLCQEQDFFSGIINTFALRTGVMEKQRVPCTPACLHDMYASHHPLHHSAVQIHFDMPPTASVDIIKRRHLLGKPLGKCTCALILSRACTVDHITLQQPPYLLASCVWLEYVTLNSWD